MAAPQYVIDDYEDRVQHGPSLVDPPADVDTAVHHVIGHDDRPNRHHRIKRAFDLFAATTILILSIPVLIVAAAAIKLDSAGPVLFRQERTGWRGRSFTMLKLRTMVPNAEDMLSSIMHLNEADGPLFKVSDDPRVTGVGRVLRALSIDELPQMWNVIRGDMSLVGPRPALDHEVAEWPEHLYRRLDVRPGITGPWQVSGRADCTFDEYATHDLRYVEEWTPAGDLKILAKTVPAVIARRGAA